jgi:hypothetical protein
VPFATALFQTLGDEYKHTNNVFPIQANKALRERVRSLKSDLFNRVSISTLINSNIYQEFQNPEDLPIYFDEIFMSKFFEEFLDEQLTDD